MPATKAPPRKRIRRTPEQARRNLLDAALAVIRTEGIAAATTVSITRQAKVSQSSFYQHFNSVDQCLKEAAEKVAREIRQFIADDRRRIHAEGASDEVHAAHYLAILHLFQQQRPLAEVLLRGRFDPSPVGQVMGKLVDQIRDDLRQYLWGTAQQLGIAEKHQPRAALLAEFIQAKVMAAGEALLAGRIAEEKLLAEELAATVAAESMDLVQRCLSDN